MSLYTTSAVKRMLPYVWNEQAVAEGTSMGGPSIPSPSMPKARVDTSTTGGLVARYLDVKAGFNEAPLTAKERRAIVMRFGYDMSQREIAAREGCGAPTISARLRKAVEKITAQMNGAT